MTKKLYIGNLPYSVNETALQDLFSQAGTVSSAKVIIDKMSGRSKGFGFVEFDNDAEADSAVEKLNGYELEGRSIKVSEARPQEENRSGGRDRGGNNFRRGGAGGGRNSGGGGRNGGGRRGSGHGRF